jgi:hypothetical protein
LAANACVGGSGKNIKLGLLSRLILNYNLHANPSFVVQQFVAPVTLCLDNRLFPLQGFHHGVLFLAKPTLLLLFIQQQIAKGVEK